MSTPAFSARSRLRDRPPTRRHGWVRRAGLLAAALLVGFVLVSRPSAMIEPPIPEQGEPELALVLPAFPPTPPARSTASRRAHRSLSPHGGPPRSRLGQRIPGLGRAPARPRPATRPLSGRSQGAARPP